MTRRSTPNQSPNPGPNFHSGKKKDNSRGFQSIPKPSTVTSPSKKHFPENFSGSVFEAQKRNSFRLRKPLKI
jgi:hypothetical protein